MRVLSFGAYHKMMTFFWGKRHLGDVSMFFPRRRSFAHLEPEIFRAGDGTQRVPEEVSFWISKVGWFNPTNDETLGVWSSILTHHWSSSKSQLHCRHLPILFGHRVQNGRRGTAEVLTAHVFQIMSICV